MPITPKNLVYAILNEITQASVVPKLTALENGDLSLSLPASLSVKCGYYNQGIL